MKANNLRNLIILFSITSLLFLSGCNQNNPQPNNAVTIKWNATIDGQNYSWEDSYPSSTGSSQYNSTNKTISLSKTSGGNVAISFGKSTMTQTGTYTFSQSNFSSSSLASISINNVTWGNAYGGSLNLTISSFSSQTVTSNTATSANITKGSFSGTIGKSIGGTSSVSGSFEAVRLN